MKTYGELLTSLITHYEWCVESLPEDWELRDEFLSGTHLNDGICFAARNKCFVELNDTCFIENFTNNHIYLCDTPNNSPYEDAIKLLQTRIDRMKEVYDEWKDVEIGV